MPIAFIAIGLILVITGVKDTYSQFGALVKSDFTGPGNFTTWLVALGLIGALGYVKTLRPFANGFLALVVLVIVLKNGGVFDNLKNALSGGATPTPAQNPPTIPASGAASNSSSATAAAVIPSLEAASMAFL